MTAKSFTSLSVKIFERSSTFGIYNIILTTKTNFYQIKIMTMMKSYDKSVEINQNPKLPYIPDHSYRILIIGGAGSGKTNVIELNKKSRTRY